MLQKYRIDAVSIVSLVDSVDYVTANQKRLKDFGSGDLKLPIIRLDFKSKRIASNCMNADLWNRNKNSKKNSTISICQLLHISIFHGQKDFSKTQTKNLLIILNPSKNHTTSLLAFFFIILLFVGCKKDITEVSDKEDRVKAKLFARAAITDPIISRVANAIKEKNAREHFLVSFTEDNGYFLWDKAEKVKSPTGVLVIIPFAKEDATDLNGFVVASGNPTMTNVRFNVLRKDIWTVTDFPKTEQS